MKKLNIKNYKGFTLIEMLVVVLIIGILAAIALPQYKNAVRKARVAEAQTILRAIIDASDRGILANGLPNDMQAAADIDVDVETDTKNWIFNIEECIEGDGLGGCYAEAFPKWESGYAIDFYSVNYDGGSFEGNGKFICNAYNDNGHKICKSLGGQLIDGYDDYYKI